jgi:hypothetical protein
MAGLAHPLTRGPAIEKAALGGFLIVGHDNIELSPFAPRQRPAPEACGLKSQQQSQQRIDDKDSCAGDAKSDHGDIDHRHQHDPAEQRQPETIPGQPDHAENGGPNMKAVAHEGKAIGRAKIRVAGHGCMNCIDRHLLPSFPKLVTRRPKTRGVDLTFATHLAACS